MILHIGTVLLSKITSKTSSTVDCWGELGRVHPQNHWGQNLFTYSILLKCSVDLLKATLNFLIIIISRWSADDQDSEIQNLNRSDWSVMSHHESWFTNRDHHDGELRRLCWVLEVGLVSCYGVLQRGTSSRWKCMVIMHQRSIFQNTSDENCSWVADTESQPVHRHIS